MGWPKKWFFRISLLGSLTIMSVPVHGNVRVAFDSTSLDFGNVAISGSRELVLEVWDTAAVPIEIDHLSATGSDPSDFTIVSPNMPVVVSPGTIHTQIIIQFSPQTFGSRSALLLIETSDGNVTIPMSGNGFEGAALTWGVDTINFGAVPPGGELDTTIELYSTGTDTAILDNIFQGASDTSFGVRLVNGALPPIALAPGDSLAVQIAFRGLDLTGIKSSQLIAIGNLVNSTTCELIGDDEYGSFIILPSPTFDFGVMYAGQMLDTTIQLVNSGAVPLTFDGLDLSPSGVDFTLLNPPQTPFTVLAGDTLSLAVQANPGMATPHRTFLQVVSQQASPNAEQYTLTVSVIEPPIFSPLTQSLSYSCGIVSAIADTIPVSDTGVESVIITSVESNDPNVTLQSNVSFPDTISAGTTQPVIIHFSPSAGNSDTLVLSMLGGTQVMFSDTLSLRALPTEAAVSIAATASITAKQHVEVGPANDLAAFKLDSIVIHIVVVDTNVVTIEPSTISLAVGITNASIVSTRQEPGGYAVTITSTSPITISAGSPFITMDLNRYVSSVDSTEVTAAIETPAFVGCLNWMADTTMVSGLSTCGSTALQAILSGHPNSIFAAILQNPISGESAELSIHASESGDARYEVFNALGTILFEGSLHFVFGMNMCSIPLRGIPSGVYMIRLDSDVDIPSYLQLIKID